MGGPERVIDLFELLMTDSLNLTFYEKFLIVNTFILLRLRSLHLVKHNTVVSTEWTADFSIGGG